MTREEEGGRGKGGEKRGGRGRSSFIVGQLGKEGTVDFYKAGLLEVDHPRTGSRHVNLP